MVLPKTRHIPTRSCVSCGLKLPKRQLIRIFRIPEGSLRVDPVGKGTGRGAYLCDSASCWERGVGKGVLERGLRSPLSAADKEYLRSFYQDNVQQNVSENLVGLPAGEEL
jgi:predicted RNA-binding protein YlxR (DUF448 family)